MEHAGKAHSDFVAGHLKLGDPLLFHAFGVVVCLGRDHKVAGRDIVMWGRLGNAVHKTIILATLRDDQVHYISLRWSGEL
ncbi:hypothetical protein MRX96_052377 [Rhipicephalus microplus]